MDCPNNQSKDKFASKKVERGEELTFHGKRMKYLQPTALQLRVRKTICASW